MKKTYISSKQSPYKNKLFLVLTIIWILITLFLFIYFIKSSNIINNISNLNNNNTLSWNINDIEPLEEYIDTTDYSIWIKIMKTWILSWSDNISKYTHTLDVLSWTEILWLKSKNIDLSIYTWEVKIKWVVEDINEWFVTIEVENVDIVYTPSSINLLSWDISILSWENLSWDNLTWKNLTWDNMSGDIQKIKTFFSFQEYWMNIDFKNNTWYSVQYLDWKINIWSISWNINEDWIQNINTLVTISPFTCKWENALSDCKMLTNRFEQFKVETATSINWIKFYKMPETEKWYFNIENIWWFYATPISKSKLIEIIKYIQPTINATVKNKIKQNISNICKDSDTTMTYIKELKISNSENWELIWEVIWLDNNANQLNCKISISVWDSIITNLIELNKTWSSNNTENSIQSTGSAINLNSTWTSYLKYTSNTYWFNINFPKSYSFKWVAVNPIENFGINWIKCSYKVNWISYKEKDLLDTDPTIEVYYCDTTWLNWENINWLIWWQNLIHRTNTDWSKNFLIRYKDRSIAENLIIE